MSKLQIKEIKEEIARIKTMLLNKDLSPSKVNQLMVELIGWYSVAEQTMKADKE